MKAEPVGIRVAFPQKLLVLLMKYCKDGYRSLTDGLGLSNGIEALIDASRSSVEVWPWQGGTLGVVVSEWFLSCGYWRVCWHPSIVVMAEGASPQFPWL